MSHRQMKQHLFYTFLAIFIATAAITLLGITSAITIPDFYLRCLTGALLIEFLGAVVALYRKADFFGPESQEDSAAQKPTQKIESAISEIKSEQNSQPTQILQPLQTDFNAAIFEERAKQELPEIDQEKISKTIARAKIIQPAAIARQLETARSFVDYLHECEKQIPAAELDEKAIFNRFIGLPISWALEIDSIRVTGQYHAEISASERIIQVDSGPISTLDHPEIKLLRKGDKIMLSGNIEKIHSKYLYTLTNSRIQSQ